MLKNKILPILALLVLFMIACAVSAANDHITLNDADDDGNNTLKYSNNIMTKESTLNTNLENKNIENNGDTVSADGESHSTDTSFTQLAKDIKNSHGVLNLKHDYTYDPTKDTSYKNGINITNNLTINGNKHVIDGSNTASAFYIKSKTLTINNLTITTNCASIGGGAINNGGSLNVKGSSFINCSCNGSFGCGGAIDNYGSLNVTGSNFINCSSRFGGAIYNSGNLSATGSSFINCSSSKWGGAISNSGDSLSVTGSIFDNCNSDYGIIYIKSGNYDLNGNYWCMNCTTVNEFKVDSLIMNSTKKLNSLAPDNWVVMNITNSSGIVAGQDNSFSATLNTLQDGTVYSGNLPDYETVISDDNGKSINVNITNGKGDFNYTPASAGKFSLVASSINSGKILTNDTFADNSTCISYSQLAEDIIDTSYSQLAEDIKNSGGVLNLKHDYTYDPTKDTSYKNGINITNNLTINGNNHVISGSNTASAFDIKSGILTINNLTITNCSSSWGGAIYNYDGGSLNVTGSNFINCPSSGSGGAIYNYGGSLNVTGSNFINCSCNGSFMSNGGAICNYWSGILNVTGSNFINCSSNKGGAIYNIGGSLIVTGSIFDNCTSSKGVIFTECGNYNLNGNYWCMNCTTAEEFKADNLIIKDTHSVAPDNWIIMNITNSSEIVADKDNSFSATLNTLQDGTAYSGTLPDYETIITDETTNNPIKVNIVNGVGSFNYTPVSAGNFSLVASSLNTGNVLSNSTFTAFNL